MIQERTLTPKVLVLLASYNGYSWLPEQIQSILNQSQVDTHLIISDDQSVDGSAELIQDYASRDSRITLLPSVKRYGSAGSNFYRLLQEANTEGYAYIALADQDDIWLSNKLHNQISLIKFHQVDAVSSNVVAYWPDGKRALVDKAQPQRRLDFLFESAGPGCTFLMNAKLAAKVKSVLNDPALPASSVALHDWLIYTICRSNGGKWWIDQRPTLKYRQHGKNVIGVNQGFNAWHNRFRLITNKWYRDEVSKLALIARKLSDDPYIQSACNALLGSGTIHKLRLLKYMPQSRRNNTERMFLTAMLMLHLY
jgi:rhamnosyltransferase